MSKEQRTYQTRLTLGTDEEAILSSYAALYGKAERTLFARLMAGGNLTDLKREFLPKFGITARQFNAMASTVKGMVASIRERRKGLIGESMERIGKAEKALVKIADPFKRHQKKRRLLTLLSRLKALKNDHDKGTVRICFGGKKLFHAQFALDANGYRSVREWREDWKGSRQGQFFVIGSKDEMSGCQSSVATIKHDGSIGLRLRLPNALISSGKHLDIPGLRFGHGHDAVAAAISGNDSPCKANRQAINYRFVKDEKGWRVFVTIALPEREKVSLEGIGVVAVDINDDHIAVTESDRSGNPTEYFSVPCATYGKTTNQRNAVIGDAIKKIVAFAVSQKKPLVIEKLDFIKKKSALREESPKSARRLSSFAYAGIQAVLRARAFDAGVEVCEVSPAYTTVIGECKYSRRYGMSGHNAAALVIGRRSMGFRETLPRELHVTLPLSVRNRGRHVWSMWAAVARRAQAAHVAHRRSNASRSSPSPGWNSAKERSETIPSVAGEIPAGESLPTLFGERDGLLGYLSI